MLICMATYLECAEELRHRLRTMRKERDLSQDQLSEQMDGLHRRSMQSRLSRLENGNVAFTLQDLFLIASVYGRDFFNGVGFPFADVTVVGRTATGTIPRDQLRGRLADVVDHAGLSPS